MANKFQIPYLVPMDAIFRKTILFVLFALTSYAAVYPAVMNSNTDLIIIDDVQADTAVRLEVFARAKHSIEMVSHIHTSGKMGMTITHALRNALERGVEVKYLYEQNPSRLAGDFFSKASRYLVDAELSKQPTLMIGRNKDRKKSTFAYNDFFHEKIVIIDRGFPSETIIIGGRNYDEWNLKYADFSYIIRPLNVHERYMGTAIINHFDQIWDTAEKHFSKEQPVVLGEKDKKFLQAFRDNQIVPKLDQNGLEILATLTNYPLPSDELKQFQFRPQWSRLITNDTMKNIATGKYKKKSGIRKEFSEDDISSYISELFAGAKNVSFNTYLMLLPEIIKQGLYRTLKNKGKVIAYTNASEAYQVLTPGKFAYVGNLISGVNHQAIVDMAKVAQGDHLTAYSVGPSDKEIYSHKKLALVETSANYQSKFLSLIGSYNYTLSSATKNSEMVVIVEDSRAYEYHMHRNQVAVDSGQARKITLDEAKMGAKKTQLARSLCVRFFESLF